VRGHSGAGELVTLEPTFSKTKDPLSMDCIFCKIAAGEIPAKLAYQDDDVVAFHDLTPQAPTHILIIPRKHITTINDLTAADAPLTGRRFLDATHITAQAGFAATGYRLVMTPNRDAGQSVFHIHLARLAGRSLSWPPG